MIVRKVLAVGTTNRAVQKVLKYEFRNQLLLQEALQGPGLHNAEGCLPIENGHKRLASVGDAILTLLVKERLFHMQQPVDSRAPLIKRLVCNANLSSVFERLGFERYLRLAKPEEFGDVVVKATAMEGILGAVYLDSNVQSTLQVCSRIGLLPSMKAFEEYAKAHVAAAGQSVEDHSGGMNDISKVRSEKSEG